MLLGVLFVESVALTPVYDTYWEVVFIGVPALIVPAILIYNNIKSAVTKHACAVALMVFAALHIHQMNGLIEAHFEVFILMAFLIIFKDRNVLLTSLLTISIHHILFYFFQKDNIGLYVFTQENLHFPIVVLHILYASFEVCIASYIAMLMKQQERSLHKHNLALEGEVESNVLALEEANIQLTAYSELLKKDKEKLEVAYAELFVFQNKLIEGNEFSQLGTLLAETTHEINKAITSSTVISDEMDKFICMLGDDRLTNSEENRLTAQVLLSNECLRNNLTRCLSLISALKRISLDKKIK